MKNFLTELYLVGVMCFSIFAAETINADVRLTLLNEPFNRAELFVASEPGEWTVYLGYLIDAKPQDAPRFSRLTDFLDRVEQGQADLSQPANSLHNLWAKKNAVAAIKAIHLADKKVTEADLSKNIKMRQFVFKRLDAVFAQLIANKKNYSADFYKELLVQRRIAARLLNHLTALEFIRFHKVFHPSVYLRIAKNILVPTLITGAAVGGVLLGRVASKMVGLNAEIIRLRARAGDPDPVGDPAAIPGVAVDSAAQNLNTAAGRAGRINELSRQLNELEVRNPMVAHFTRWLKITDTEALNLIIRVKRNIIEEQREALQDEDVLARLCAQERDLEQVNPALAEVASAIIAARQVPENVAWAISPGRWRDSAVNNTTGLFGRLGRLLFGAGLHNNEESL